MIPSWLSERFAEKELFTLNLTSRFWRLYPDTDYVNAIQSKMLYNHDLLKLNISLNKCEPSYKFPATSER